ncbi:response regulator transcription factor [Alkalihalobacterium chitinilyticum]|uniref:Response regulator transcription factor n=1 Tax=Alkalihalobacterium chitinilyticum TaxID=2980103 RepID=A0ABT5VDF4_9BACI|nr:response regulator transcription factor [Alkalihalobacterium chitinilyticum]MDE5413481.1 response regulator transcription factor [Alkalihalobacterium chitinilyticum]
MSKPAKKAAVKVNTKGKSILIVEDDLKIRQLIKVYLEREGYEVWEAEDGKQAIELYDRYEPCFTIIDLMLPQVSGEEVCQWIRTVKKSDSPIIMVTAKVDETDRINGLKMGADDYVTKPFSPKELVARVEAVLRRTANRCHKISYRGITIKPYKGEVNYAGKELSLTNNECKLLHMLMKNPNQVLSRDQMIAELYPNDEKEITWRTIDVHVRNLREKLRKVDAPDCIQTVRGMGYQFDAF